MIDSFGNIQPHEVSSEQIFHTFCPRVQTFHTYVQDWTQIGTSYLAGLFYIFILLHIWQNCVCFGDFLPMRTLCDAYHKEFESH